MLRYDDFSNGSPDELDRFLLETVAETGLGLTIAAIPLGAGPEESRGAREAPAGPIEARKADLLRPFIGASAAPTGGVELAQHGLDHRPVGSDPRGRPAEFSGQSRPRQLDRIRQGLEILGTATGTRPRTFVPPWNRYDGETAAALLELGFSVLSAGRDAPPAPLAREPSSARLSLVPATSPPHELRRAVQSARRARDGAIVVVLLHPYDFVEMGTRWSRLERSEFRELAEWLAGQPDVRPMTLGGLAASGADLGLDRMRRFGRFHESPVARWVPPAIEGGADAPLRVYPVPGDMARRAGRRFAVAGAIHGTVALAGLGSGWMLGGVAGSGAAGLLLRVALTGAAAWALSRSLRDGGPRFRGLVVSVGLGGVALGAWSS